MLVFKNYHFNQLNKISLYEMLKLRSEVFILEQNCIYLDLDGFDLNSVHVLAYSGSNIVGSSRIIKKGYNYKNYSSIGRLVLKKEYRGLGNGANLMKYSIDTCMSIYPSDIIKISAQCYLKKFYENLGFIKKGGNYLEDGIEHCSMLYVNK